MFCITVSINEQRAHVVFVCLAPAEDTVVVIPYKSRHVRLVLKGPDHLCKSW